MLDVGQGVPSDNTIKRNKGITIQSNGRWKKILSKNEVAMCQKIANKELENNGYQLEKILLYNRVFSNILYLTSVVDLIKRVYRRWKLGGTPLLKKTLHSYLYRMKNLS